jgi:FAD/FMN-containing dehydrogenase
MPVVFRTYEASYDVGQLEPSTPRLLFTYVLQEYFIPVDAFGLFLPRMAKVLQENDVNVVNISIRHALPDTGSFLAWAPQEVFSFVIYYKQSTSKQSQDHVASWTRRLIDEAIAVGGRHYLPYQIHGTMDQFKRAYPGYKAFFSIKKRLDPRNLFRNKLWDAYYQ